ncbi:MAG: methionyl-tRNA formyltransferase [Parcubacteria bacterium C7867-004]|nr:MAG: methionyl-tRNA formyltransferase [Parcubacteria bacterium C7867-004]
MHKPFLFFGTPYVARDTLAGLMERGYRPEVVITSPDAPSGRGLTLTPSEAKVWALEQNLPVLAPERINRALIESLAQYGAEYAIVVAYGKILPQSLIDAFPLGILNIHYSLLPKYRGASPVEAALLNAETVTGVTIQKMAFELDSGDIVAMKETLIGPEETTRELRTRLIAMGTELLADTLPAFESGAVTGVPQDASQATFCGRINKSEGELALSGDPKRNWNKYRAYAESPGTYFFVTKEAKRLRVKVRTAAFENGTFIPKRVVLEGKAETDFAELTKAGWTPA